MIVRIVADAVRKCRQLGWTPALLLLLFALAPAPASARVHGYGQAAWGHHHYQRQDDRRLAFRPRAHRAFAHFQRRPVSIASYARRPHVQRFTRVWHSRLRAFALAQPRFDAPSISYGGGGVIAEALRYVGAGNVTGMRGAWCADYASLVLRRTGHRALASRMVSSAFSYGPRVSQPKPGDLVVLSGRRGYASHVGFFAGYRNGQMLMVSGNWGRRVSLAPIPRRSVSAFIGV